MLASLEALLTLGKCREMPVMGFVKGHLVVGIIVRPSPYCARSFFLVLMMVLIYLSSSGRDPAPASPDGNPVVLPDKGQGTGADEQDHLLLCRLTQQGQRKRRSGLHAHTDTRALPE